MDLGKNHKWKYWILSLVGICSILGLIGCSFFNYVNADSAILLVETERIAEGYIPYETLHLNYPPLWFYINVALKWLFNVPYGCYHFYLMVHWLYTISCAICFYFIAKKWGANNYTAGFVTWLFFIISYPQQGNEVLFELPSLFFGLLSVCVFYKHQNNHPAWLMVVGMLACGSFMIKQFGAVFILLVLWLIITSSSQQSKWEQIIAYMIGYIIPIVICFSLFGTNMFKSILFNGYGTDAMDSFYGIETTLLMRLSSIFSSLFFFCNHFVPVVYVSLILLYVIFRQHKFRETLFCFFGIGGFSLQYLFVHGGRHYYLYMIPFALLMIPILLNLKTNKVIHYFIVIVIGIMTINGVYVAAHNRSLKRYVLEGENDYINQWKSNEKISNIIKDGESVYIPHVGLCYLYYTANLYPPLMAEIGYGVGPMEMTIEKCKQSVLSADYVIHYSDAEILKSGKGKIYEYYYTDSIQQYVNQFPSDTLKNEAVIHYLKRPKLGE